MRAAMHKTYGPPDNVVEIADVDTPTPKDNEVLIKVHATTVNRTDSGFVRAKPFVVRLFAGIVAPRHKILGNEFAGEVVEIGKKVTCFKMGDKIFGFDDRTFGGHGEYMTIAETRMLTTIPDDFSYEAAVAGMEGSHYALSYIRATKLHKGQRVLINGATGAIGSAAVQILTAMGVEVTAVVLEEHRKLMQSLGAKHVIAREKKDFTGLNKQFDVVFDSVGKSSFRRCKSILKPRGIYTSSELGFLAQNPILALLTRFGRGKRVMFPTPKTSQADAEYIRELMAQGHYKPVIDSTFPLGRIIDAYQRAESGEKIGNVVVNHQHRRRKQPAHSVKM